MSSRVDRIARAKRLRDYFDLQLKFAQTIAAMQATPLADAVGLYTNFHRRFGLGPIEYASDGNDWQRYISGLERCDTHDDMVDWTQEFFAQAPDETLPEHEHRFGCFSCVPPNAHGMVRIHFRNRDSADGIGPLNRSKIPKRTRELHKMFAFVQQAFPSATSVLGGSWIYNVEAYRRLFPPAYVATRALPQRRIRLNGSSSWGQFLTHREGVKPDLRARFLANWKHLDADRPWCAFPLPALVVSAPIEVFYEHYGIEAR